MADTTYQLNFTGDQINNLLTRTNNLDTELNNYLLKNGGDMAGAINMNGQNISGLGEPTEDSHAVPKFYVDNIAEIANSAKNTADSALPKSGGTMTGSITMGGNKMIGLGTPTANTDAATKGYADLAAYPVGAIYISTISTSPASLFGGTWEQLKDRFLLGAGDTYSAGSTGGEAEHTLTEAEMPKHSHTITTWYGGVGNGSAVQRGWSGESTSKLATTSTTGGGTAHNNMPPYLSVYMWKRVA